MSGSASMTSGNPERRFKIIVLGDGWVGKSCFVRRLCGQEFPVAINATVGCDLLKKRVTVDKEDCLLNIWDTAGQEKFSLALGSMYFRDSHAVIYVYDITSIESFQSLPEWIGRFAEEQPEKANITKILIGNKNDCTDDRRVSKQMANRLAKERNMSFYEVSAKEDSFEDLFQVIAHKMTSKIIESNPAPREIEGFKLKEDDKKDESSCCSC